MRGSVSVVWIAKTRNGELASIDAVAVVSHLFRFQDSYCDPNRFCHGVLPRIGKNIEVDMQSGFELI